MKSYYCLRDVGSARTAFVAIVASRTTELQHIIDHANPASGESVNSGALSSRKEAWLLEASSEGIGVISIRIAMFGITSCKVETSIDVSVNGVADPLSDVAEE